LRVGGAVAEPGGGAAPGQREPFERALNLPVGEPRARPAVDQAVHDPDDQEGEDTGERRVAEEMPAGHHAQRRHAEAERERATIGERAPLRRRQRGRRQGPGRAGHVAGDERAIGRTVAARVPPEHEMVAATEFRHIDRPRPAPMILEHDIDQQPGAERQGDDEKQGSPTGD
jgi:hypothetical protein